MPHRRARRLQEWPRHVDHPALLRCRERVRVPSDGLRLRFPAELPELGRMGRLRSELVALGGPLG
jgi:hypothetical protein